MLHVIWRRRFADVHMQNVRMQELADLHDICRRTLPYTHIPRLWV